MQGVAGRRPDGATSLWPFPSEPPHWNRRGQTGFTALSCSGAGAGGMPFSELRIGRKPAPQLVLKMARPPANQGSPERRAIERRGAALLAAIRHSRLCAFAGRSRQSMPGAASGQEARGGRISGPRPACEPGWAAAGECAPTATPGPHEAPRVKSHLQPRPGPRARSAVPNDLPRGEAAMLWAGSYILSSRITAARTRAIAWL